jgi:hypothetical protein
MAKKTFPLVDGLGSKNIAQIRTALRQVWSWSYARRLCVKRCLIEGGFSRCERCKATVPKIYPDHIIPCGDVDGGYIKRMFVSSAGLQGLCKKCHDAKTREERIVNKDFL